MNIPGLTAEYSLYRSRNSYRTATTESSISQPTDSIVPALNAAGWAACDDCEKSCGENYSWCMAAALLTSWIPLIGGGLGISCVFGSWYCLARCHAEGHACCPKDCGSYCCSYGEQCSHLSGCCPGDQIVCGGRCCAPGDSCCGDRCCNAGQTCCGETCCAPGQTCCGGVCCSGNCCGDTCCGVGVPCCGDKCCGFSPGPPPPPPVNNCIFGGAPCGPKCCPPGLQCCSYTAQFGAECKTSCIN